MCGVAGIFDRKSIPVELARMRRMMDSIRHRGPDSEGITAFSSKATIPPINRIHTEDNHITQLNGAYDFLLGHRRLSTDNCSQIISQPIANEDHTIWLSFDGHVYNGCDLRLELKLQDHVFRSDCEAEVVLHLYEEKKLDLLSDLDGIFAFALWDDREKRLILARDRIGAKPLYYVARDRHLAFASEVRALIAGGIIVPELWPPSLAEYFAFQNTFGRETLFKDVNILLPGAYVILEGNRLTERSWWEAGVNSRVFSKASPAECAKQLRQVLSETVEAQIPYDVPVGSYLSGGIDSGTVVALASALSPHFSTFTCGFNLSRAEDSEPSFDERSNAKQIASHCRTSHHEMVLGPDHMARALPRLVLCQEELRLGMTYQNYYAAELASKFVNVVLDGIGGDELFAGYPWRHIPALRCKTRDEFDSLYLKTYQRMVPDSERIELFSGPMRRAIAEYSPQESFRQVFSPGDPTDDFLHLALLFEIRTVLQATLINEDKIHMSRSLDLRVPLVGNQLVDFALSIPAEWKLHEGLGKFIFRRAIEGLLPQKMLVGRKQGFCPPDRSWFQGPTLPYIRDILFSKRAQSRNVFNPRYVERIVDEHIRGCVDHRLLIWSFLCFEWWSRIWIDGDKVDSG